MMQNEAQPWKYKNFFFDLMASKHQHDLVMCRRLPGIHIGKLCEKCDGRCPICDSWVNPETKVRICEDCNFGTTGTRCIICSQKGVADAYYCRECTELEKDRDGCPRIVNLNTAKVDRFYSKSKPTGFGQGGGLEGLK
jgi:hypothetical protein